MESSIAIEAPTAPIESSVGSHSANASPNNSLDPLTLSAKLLRVVGELASSLLMAVARWTLGWLSQSFSITLRMSTLVMLVLVAIIAAWAYIRYRFLTVYSRLPEDNDEEEDELWIKDEDETAPYATYFDEFLAAIKIFGYLDKKVFDELTRHMRTYRIDEGETIHLKDLDGFAVVTNGCMKVYNQANGQYQLINEVKKSGPISPLFSVLDLLTVDVDISSNIYRSEAGLNSDEIPDISLNEGARGSVQGQGQGPAEGPSHAQAEGPHSPPRDFDHLNENIYAAAAQTTRIAIIPRETFHLLARKYPAQAANIIQVILLRWYQVTVTTCGDLLDLTDLVVEPEIDLNRTSASRVPVWVKDGALKRLMHAAAEDPEVNVFTLKPRKKIAATAPASRSHHVSVEQIDKNYPGDLVSNVPILSRSNSVFDQQELMQAFGAIQGSRKDSIQGPLQGSLQGRTQGPSDDSEDAVSRKAIAGEMFRLLGFDATLKKTKINHRDSLLSVPNSPLFAGGLGGGLGTKLGSGLGGLGGLGTAISDSASIAESEKALESPAITYEELVETAANMVQVQLFRKGEKLASHGDKCPGIYYVIDGSLAVSYKGKHCFDAHPGNVTGYLETVASQLAYFDVVATSDVVVARLSKKNFERISDSYPLVYMSTAKVLTTIARKSILLLNFALEWTHLSAGETLYREGTQADAIYCVVSGRIRSFFAPRGTSASSSGTKAKGSLKGEYGQGRYLAQLETLVGDKYNCTAVAIRETELARIPRTLIEYLAKEYPHTPFKMTKLVAEEVARKDRANQLELGPAGVPGLSASMSSLNEFSTLAVLPIGENLPVREFAAQLVEAFRTNGRDTVNIDRTTVLDYLGKHAFSGVGSLKLKTYLAGLEQQHETLVFVASDSSVSSQWTKTCVEQADCVLLLANAAAAPAISDYEKVLLRSKTNNRCHLILLHNDEQVSPGTTALWLKRRQWVTAHHHIQMDLAPPVEPLNPPTKRKGAPGLKALQEIGQKIQHEFNDRRKQGPLKPKAKHNHYRYKNDFHRLARILSGEAVGLVLGGGGARGLSHLGVIKALEEKGIPVDMIGGTSIGSFVGGLYAHDYDTLDAYRKAKKFSSRFASIWHILLDLTYPATSYTTGHAFNRGIWKTFGNARIEDFWLKFFSNTTNITHSRMEIHKSGYAWRYIRASMSLAGLVPPLEDKGEMLLDGGYMDNLPVGEMRACGAKWIIAVDVGSVDDTTPMKYGDSLSGLWVLLNRYNPFSTHPNIPNLAEIQARLAYVSSVKALERAKAAPNVLYLRPPIDLYATLDFGKFDEIMSVGYTYAIRKLRELEASGELAQISGIKDSNRWVPELSRRHSF